MDADNKLVASWLIGAHDADAPYEVNTLRRLMGKYATREREIDSLLRNQVFVDLYTVVRQELTIGTSSYSLKDIEHLYLAPRQGEVITAGGSVVEYQKWLDAGESENWAESRILSGIRDYNKADCFSTWELARWLRQIQVERVIHFIPVEREASQSVVDEGTEDDHIAARKARELLQNLEQVHTQDAQRGRVQALLAWLLEFHWREAKPIYWRRYAWAEMTEPELVADLDCLGALHRTSRSPISEKKSRLFEYRFDADQDTKVHKETTCRFANEPNGQTMTIASINRLDGLVELKLGPTRGVPPDTISLVADELVSPKPIDEPVYRYVDTWSNGKFAAWAIDDLLHRRRPRSSGWSEGPILPAGIDPITGITGVIRRMDNTVLCIQGPPGTGKTYTAAAAIVQLLLDGKKIAITANTHKAILNVLSAVHTRCEKQGLRFSIVKVSGGNEDPLITTGAISYAKGGGDAAKHIADGPLALGGTAWVFSRAELCAKFDYLFVDEAGQFSLANLVGAGQAAKNLVLIGDQMQLAQPLKGSHPGESGKSELVYLLCGRATIPNDFGIFLDRTWRMHPSICSFISEAVYEGRLHSHPSTMDQRILAPFHAGSLVTKETGIEFLPVEHTETRRAVGKRSRLLSRSSVSC
jgi:uncharacterized protein